MGKEHTSLITKDTWALVPLPNDANLVSGKWVFTKKYNSDGTVERYKARWVARGFTQRYGIDYHETFAPVMKYASFRILLAYAAQCDLEIKQLDVETAFLNADIKEDLYMVQPQGYETGGMVCKLKKTLYGIKQAPHDWNQTLNAHITNDLLFNRCVSDTCVYTKTSQTGRQIILGVFVDDIVHLYHKADEAEVSALKATFMKQFKMTDKGDAEWILGMKIVRDRSQRYISITQPLYIEEILQTFGMEDCKPKRTPMNHYKLSSEDCPTIDSTVTSTTRTIRSAPTNKYTTESSVAPSTTSTSNGKKLKKNVSFNMGIDIKQYEAMVGSLLYATITTRPDIGYGVNQVARYMKNPGLQHEVACKRILRYLRNSSNLGLEYYGFTGSSNDRMDITVPIHLHGYTDADWAGDMDTRKSTTGYAIMMNGCLISWGSKKQGPVALSTAEAELYAASETAKELMWAKQFIQEVILQPIASTTILCDNQSTIQIAEHSSHHNRIKHIDIRYWFIRDLIEKGELTINYVPTEFQVADIFTKALGTIAFERLRSLLMDASNFN
jgi:hypothetical protein